MEEEEWEKEQKKKDPKVIWVDGEVLIELPPSSLIETKSRKQDSVNHPFNFGWLKETKRRQPPPGLLDEIKKIFNTPSMPANWKVFKITEHGEIKELKDEDEENDNAK